MSLLCGGVDGTRIFGDIETWNTDLPGGTGNLHHLIEDDRRLLAARMTSCLKSHRVDRAVYLRATGDGCDHLAQSVTLVEIYRSEANFCGVRQSLLIEIANHHDSRT